MPWWMLPLAPSSGLDPTLISPADIYKSQHKESALNQSSLLSLAPKMGMSQKFLLETGLIKGMQI